jgi:hypothetical protein
MQGDGYGAASGADDEIILGDQTNGVEVPREHSRPVAAHLGETSISISVVHEEFSLCCLAFVPPHVFCSDHSQNAVATYASMAVAEVPDLLSSEVLLGVNVWDDDEVIAGAMALHERNFVDADHE